MNRFTHEERLDAPQAQSARYIEDMLLERGLPVTASQAEILPVASAMWGDPNQRVQALELLAGRYIDSAEITEGDDLAVMGAYTMPDARSALDFLLQVREQR